MIHWSGTFFYLSLVIFPEITSPGQPSSGRLYFKTDGWTQAIISHEGRRPLSHTVSFYSNEYIFLICLGKQMCCNSSYKDHQKLRMPRTPYKSNTDYCCRDYRYWNVKGLWEQTGKTLKSADQTWGTGADIARLWRGDMARSWRANWGLNPKSL